jgi:hypothetical protein
MSNRFATLIVSDDLHVDLTGKFSIYGVYTGDIQIAVDPSSAAKLIFLVVAETDADDPFKSMVFQLKFPGEPEMQWPIPTIPPPPVPGRNRHIIRWPFLILMPTLRQGHIEAKIIHEKGEILVAAPWILMPKPPTLVPTS